MFPAHQLQLEQLACQRGDRVLFTDLSLQFQSGDFVQIEGHNGIGKTSLLRILAGLAQPVEGKVRWNSDEINKTTRRIPSSATLSRPPFWCET